MDCRIWNANARRYLAPGEIAFGGLRPNGDETAEGFTGNTWQLVRIAPEKYPVYWKTYWIDSENNPSKPRYFRTKRAALSSFQSGKL